MTDEMILGKLERLEHLTLLSAKKVLTIDDVSALTGLSKARLYALIGKYHTINRANSISSVMMWRTG